MTAPRRLQLRRTKGWRKTPGGILVTRPHSRWANPFVVGQYAEAMVSCQTEHRVGRYGQGERCWATSVVSRSLSAEHAVAMYEDELVACLTADDPYYDEMRGALEELRGHDIYCWCALDEPCHGDVVLRLANGPRLWTPA